MLTIFIRTGLISLFFTGPKLSDLMVFSFKVNVLFKHSMLEVIRLKFGGGGYLLNTLVFICSGAYWMKTCCSSEYGHSDWHHNRGKGSTMPNTLNFILPLLSLSWTCLILISTEVQIFVYSGTNQECEGIIYSLLDLSPCTDDMQIIGRWCSKPFTEAKETS